MLGCCASRRVPLSESDLGHQRFESGRGVGGWGEPHVVGTGHEEFVEAARVEHPALAGCGPAEHRVRPVALDEAFAVAAEATLGPGEVVVEHHEGSPGEGRAVLIVVENLPVPLDRRVWQEATALRDRGHQVIVVCPRMWGFTASEEVLDGIQIYRHWISGEGRGFLGFLREYASALFGETRLAWKASARHGSSVMVSPSL